MADVHKAGSSLLPTWSGFNNQTIGGVNSEDIAVRCDGEAQRHIEWSAHGHGYTGSCICGAGKRVGNGCDTALERVGNEKSSISRKAQTRRSDHQGVRVGALLERAGDGSK